MERVLADSGFVIALAVVFLMSLRIGVSPLETF